jgi:hypothetical protein
MKLADTTFNATRIAAFFFFSWIIQLLWNSILVDQLALIAVKLSYWQAAALWLLTTILFAWVGAGAHSTHRTRIQRRSDWDEIGNRIERKVRGCVSRWVEDREDRDDDLGERIEAKIKRGFSRWVGVDEEIDWDDLGEHIERKIKQKVRDWADEE